MVGGRPPNAPGPRRGRLEHAHARAIPLAERRGGEHAADPRADDGDLDGRVVEGALLLGGRLVGGRRRRGHFGAGGKRVKEGEKREKRE